MSRLQQAILRPVALSIVFCSLCGTAAAGPGATTVNGDGKEKTGGFEGVVPLVIGGAITVAVLGMGFILLNAKQQAPRAAFREDAFEQLPPNVVPGPNPLRYFVMPVVLLTLLAVFVPLGYSLWSSMPDTLAPKLPKQEDLHINMQPAFEWSTIKPVQLQSTDFKMPQFPPPTIQIPQAPPIRVPVVTPPHPPRR